MLKQTVFPMRRVLSFSRFLVIIAVIGSFLCACALFFYGAKEVFVLLNGTVSNTLSGKSLVLKAIESVDTFLLATVFYIIALGLYELFVDDTIPVPAWLQITSLDDLKAKLLGVVATILAVAFLGQVLTWDGERNLQPFGFGIAAVIAAIAFYTRKK